jgi:hypothetical protein
LIDIGYGLDVFDFLKDYLNETLLRKKNKNGQIFLHQVKKLEILGALLNYITTKFDSKFTKELLLIEDDDGKPSIFYLVQNLNCLNILSTYFNSEELKNLLLKLNCILQVKTEILKDTLEFMKINYEDEFLFQLIKSTDKNTILHSINSNSDTLKILKEVFDKNFLKKLIEAKNHDGRTFMFFINNYDNLNSILKFLLSEYGIEFLKSLVLKTDNFGNTFIFEIVNYVENINILIEMFIVLSNFFAKEFLKTIFEVENLDGERFFSHLNSELELSENLSQFMWLYFDLDISKI